MLHVHLILVQLSFDIGIAVHLDLLTRKSIWILLQTVHVVGGVK